MLNKSENDIDYHDLPVVICAVGSGVAYGNLGYSHHAIQDLALMRSLPNMMIGTPCDPQQVVEILEYQYENPKPLYLRLHKAGESSLMTTGEKIKPGQLKKLIHTNEGRAQRQEQETCILCIGHIASQVIDLCKAGIETCSIYSVPLWGASSSKYFAEQIGKFKKIITVEDHILEGGFGSYALEVAAKYTLNTQIIPIALRQDIIGKVAKEETLLKSLIDDLSCYLGE